METTLTTSLLAVWFRKFNAQYFDNKLIMPKFNIVKTRESLGRFQILSNYFERIILISISDFYIRDEKGYQETLIHEMIHEEDYILHGQCMGHGTFFHNECNRINKYGWHLSTTTDLWDEIGMDNFINTRYGSVLKKKRYVGIIYRKGDTNMFVFCFDEKNLERVMNIWCLNTYTYYEMKNPQYFITYPSTGNGMSLRGRRIAVNSKDAKEVMENVEPLEMQTLSVIGG